MSGFVHRGVVEGFYGEPYSHADRLWLVERMGRWGMNRYLHAPKDDALQRARWRDLYSPEALRDFGELVEVGARAGVEVGFALSPGLSIEYSSAADQAALGRKLGSLEELGSRFFGLAFDDVPSELAHASDRAQFSSLAEAHVATAHALLEALGASTTLWVVPTDYLGTRATDYLTRLGEELDASIEIAWTGRTVFSPQISGEDAAAIAAALRRRILIWDNYPANDGPSRAMLQLGPYSGRAGDLASHASGVMLNPMQQPRASAIALRTAADYLRDPALYDPAESWRAALQELGGGVSPALTTFAAAHRFSALAPDDRDRELEAALHELRAAFARGRASTSHHLDEVRRLLDARSAVALTLRHGLEDRDLVREIEPWLTAHHTETERMSAALDLLATLHANAGPESSAPDSARMLESVYALLRMEGRLTRNPPAAVTSYGPRRLLVAQLVSLREDSAGFGDESVLFRDRCLSDEFVRFVEDQALARLGGLAND